MICTPVALCSSIKANINKILRLIFNSVLKITIKRLGNTNKSITFARKFINR